MSETGETLRQRTERIFRLELTENPTALRLATEPRDTEPGYLTMDEALAFSRAVDNALRVALFDLAEQLDALLGSEV